MSARLADWALPVVIFCIALAAWETLVAVYAIEPYILPAPSLDAKTIVTDWPILATSLWVTLKITFAAILLAVAGGAALASCSRNGAGWSGPSSPSPSCCR